MGDSELVDHQSHNRTPQAESGKHLPREGRKAPGPGNNASHTGAQREGKQFKTQEIF